MKTVADLAVTDLAIALRDLSGARGAAVFWRQVTMLALEQLHDRQRELRQLQDRHRRLRSASDTSASTFTRS